MEVHFELAVQLRDEPDGAKRGLRLLYPTRCEVETSAGTVQHRWI